MTAQRASARPVSSADAGASDGVMPAELASLRASLRWSLSDVVVDAAYAVADQVQAANKHGVSADEARQCWQSAQQALTVADRYLRELVNGVPSAGLDDPWAAEEPPF